jgi:hypothetical protein
VTLDVYLKNARTLIVKVFEVNTANYYREVGRESTRPLTSTVSSPGRSCKSSKKIHLSGESSADSSFRPLGSAAFTWSS